jgi:hypothetical protein
VSTQPHTPPMAARNEADPEQLAHARVLQAMDEEPSPYAQPPRSRHRLRRLTGIPTGANAL